MKTVHHLSFGVYVSQGDITYGKVMFKIIASTSHMALFIRSFEEQSGTELLYDEIIELAPYYHQTIMDI